MLFLRKVSTTSRILLWCLVALTCKLITAADQPKQRGNSTERGLRLLEHAEQTQSISYEMVSAAAYGFASIPTSLLAEKHQWRAHAISLGFTFLSDYRLIKNATTVEFQESLPKDKGSPALLAIYHAPENHIHLSRSANGFTLMHEAGHSLQRKAIRRTASNTSSNAFAASIATETSVSPARKRLIEQFRYLSSQDELEIRLQDLNRFYANLSQSREFLLSPIDAITALSALGMDLGVAEIEVALSDYGLRIDSYLTQSAIKRGKSLAPDAFIPAYDDARDLLTLRKLALHLEPNLWPPLLAKLVYEAPGHL